MWFGAAAQHLKVSPAAVEAVVARRKAAGSQHRRGDAVLGGATGMERLGHRAEIHAQSGGKAGSDANGVRRVRGIKPSRRAVPAAPANVPAVAVL